MFTLTLSSYFGSPGGSWLHINVVINWQLSKQGIRWPVSPDRIAGSGVEPSRSSILLKLSADNLFVFKWLQAHVYFFKNSYQICCVYVSIAPHYYDFDFKLTLDAKIQPVFLKYRRGRPFLTMVTCWSRFFMLWLVKIWQVSSCGKFMQHLESCLLWQLNLTEFWVNLWCF